MDDISVETLIGVGRGGMLHATALLFGSFFSVFHVDNNKPKCVFIAEIYWPVT